MKAAFIYLDAGKGHYIPAKALYDSYTLTYNENAVIANLFDIYSSSFLKRTIEDSWRLALRYPRMQRLIYPLIDNPLDRFLLEKLANTKGHLKAFSSWMEKEKPDFILSTNFITGLLLAHAVDRLGYETPVFQYAADCVSTQRVGVTNKLRYMYFVTEKGIRTGIKRGMLEEKVKLCPFPLQYKIENSKRLTIKEARDKLELDDLFTIAFSMGGEGISRLTIIKEADRKGMNIQFILLGKVTGRTAHILERIKKEVKSVRIITPGFVDNVNEYIEASDMTMGKAGANSVMESIFLKRFTLISDQLYPFEGIKSILEEHGIGKVENDEGKQLEIISALYEHKKVPTMENFEGIGITFSSKEFIKMLINDAQSCK